MANLIFLALSLLHSGSRIRTSDIGISTFYPPTEEENPDKEKEILYLGQMDPIVIWKANQYKDENLIVVALCTEKVLCTPYSSEDPVTSAEFFMKNVCEATDKELDLSSYRKEFHEQEFGTADGKIRFRLIPVNEEDLYPGIRKSVDAIREWNNTKERSKDKFWIDVHGGFRSTMTVLSGIISLLKIDGITPDRVYSPRFDNSDNKLTLPKSTEEIEIFDFVSGMDDFINYGNADMLREYFGRHNGSEYEQDILAAIDKVALGTQCCDTVSYKQGLSELSKLLKRPEPSDSSLLGLFINYIKDSYGELLTKHRTTLMIIKRCVNKKMYQQALTFIEASMPEEIVKKGLLSFGIVNYQSSEIIELSKDYGLEYYLFNAYLKMGNLYPLKVRRSLKNSANCYVRQEEKLRAFLDGKKPGRLDMDTYVNTNDKNNTLPFDKKKTTNFRDLPMTVKDINSKVPVEDRDALGIFLRLHQLLKLCRNAYNHSLEDRPELADLLKLFELYIDFAEYLYKKCS